MSAYSGSSDLAGQLSAAFSATAVVSLDSDPAYYKQLMNMSTLLCKAGVVRRGLYTMGLHYPCATNNACSSNVGQTSGLLCMPGDEFFQGAMVATYNSTSYRDDMTWAATNDSLYLSHHTGESSVLMQHFEHMKAL